MKRVAGWRCGWMAFVMLALVASAYADRDRSPQRFQILPLSEGWGALACTP